MKSRTLIAALLALALGVPAAAQAQQGSDTTRDKHEVRRDRRDRRGDRRDTRRDRRDLRRDRHDSTTAKPSTP